jgi:hypothetical protein
MLAKSINPSVDCPSCNACHPDYSILGVDIGPAVFSGIDTSAVNYHKEFADLPTSFLRYPIQRHPNFIGVDVSPVSYEETRRALDTLHLLPSAMASNWHDRLWHGRHPRVLQGASPSADFHHAIPYAIASNFRLLWD